MWQTEVEIYAQTHSRQISALGLDQVFTSIHGLYLSSDISNTSP